MNIINVHIFKYMDLASRINENYEYHISFIIINGCIIAPLCEEFIMRGVILGGLLKKYDYRIAIIISAIFFGASHFNKSKFIVGTIIGIILGLLYVKYKSLILCMIIHCICNSTSEIFMMITKDNVAISYIFSIIGLIIMIVMFKLLNKEDEKRKRNIVLIGNCM